LPVFQIRQRCPAGGAHQKNSQPDQRFVHAPVVRRFIPRPQALSLNFVVPKPVSVLIPKLHCGIVARTRNERRKEFPIVDCLLPIADFIAVHRESEGPPSQIDNRKSAIGNSYCLWLRVLCVLCGKTPLTTHNSLCYVLFFRCHDPNL
jgi:hypothetical protein